MASIVEKAGRSFLTSSGYRSTVDGKKINHKGWDRNCSITDIGKMEYGAPELGMHTPSALHYF